MSWPRLAVCLLSVLVLAAATAPAAHADPSWEAWLNGIIAAANAGGGGSASITANDGPGCGAVVEGRAGDGGASSSSSQWSSVVDGRSCSVEAAVTAADGLVTCALRVEIDGAVVFDERRTGPECRLEYPLPPPATSS